MFVFSATAAVFATFSFFAAGFLAAAVFFVGMLNSEIKW
jgi:hypothetical protein